MPRFRIRDFGSCLYFAGADYVDMPSNTNLNLSGGSAVSITAWMKTQDLANNRAIVTKGQFGATTQYMMMLQANKLRMEVTTSVGGNAGLQGNFVFQRGIWYFVTTVYDGANINLYVNGTFDTSVGKTGTLTSSTDTLRIGHRLSNTEYFKGFIDDPRVYKIALTPTQIANLYYSGTEPSASNLLGEWPFNENTGSSAADSSGNGNTGTITNATWSTDVFMKPRVLLT